MDALAPQIQDLIQSIKATGRTQQEVAAETGLNYWWVNSFMQGRIRNPGWQKVEALRQLVHQDSRDGVAEAG